MHTTNHLEKLSQVLFFIVISLMVCCCRAFCEESEISNNKQVIDEYKAYFRVFQSNFGKQIEEEFGLKRIEPGAICNFYNDVIGFYAYRRATREEARALELLLLDKLSEAIRADLKMLFYLNQLSLTPESIGIDIHFVKLHNWSYNDGSINTVYFGYKEKDNKRFFRYHTTDPFTGYPFEKNWAFNSNSEELFEDAIKLNAEMSIINPTIHKPTEFEDELNQILVSYAEKMKKKYGLRFQNHGWMVAGNATCDISEIRAKCTYHYPVDCQEARALMLAATENLLSAINSSEVLRSYLKEYPFSANLLKLRMLFRKQKVFVGEVLYDDGSMESVVLCGNIITYYHDDPTVRDSEMQDTAAYAKESYQEAQTTFENTPPLTLFKKATKEIKNFTSDFIYFLESAISMFFILLLIFINAAG